MMAELVNFSPPNWAKDITNVPRHYVELCQCNTPIHEWKLPGVPPNFKVSVKRDDMTGSSLSGNKVRKLEFLLADAISKKCDTVMTCGGLQSNHCRATAIAAKQLGLKSYSFLGSNMDGEEDLGSGNILLQRMVGGKVILVPKNVPFTSDIKLRMEKMADVLREQGSNSYLIPIGGSNHIGMFGYIKGFQELVEQNVLNDFDDLVVATGSGGTSTGLAIANYLTGSKLRFHAIKVSDRNLTYCYDHLNHELKECGLDVEARDIIDVIEGYVGEGYAKSTEEELEYILKITMETGVILDRVYTGKAVRGLILEMQKNPGRFKGPRVLFIHTGGIFGVFDGELNKVLQNSETSNFVKCWKSLDDPVPDI